MCFASLSRVLCEFFYSLDVALMLAFAQGFELLVTVANNKMSSTITIPTSVTCMENVKIASLGQNHFFRSVLNSHLLLQLIYFKLFYFCHI